VDRADTSGFFVVFGNDPVEQLIAVPLWLKWCQIAVREAKLALEARPRDAQIDMMSAKLAHVDHPEVDWSPTTVDELDSSMAAIVAAALAIDGFYGSVKSVMMVPERKTLRPRKILELLKLGFVIGQESQYWLLELDWLFGLRDRVYIMPRSQGRSFCCELPKRPTLSALGRASSSRRRMPNVQCRSLWT
jgi:hypothetical protein